MFCHGLIRPSYLPERLKEAVVLSADVICHLCVAGHRLRTLRAIREYSGCLANSLRRYNAGRLLGLRGTSRGLPVGA